MVLSGFIKRIRKIKLKKPKSKLLLGIAMFAGVTLTLLAAVYFTQTSSRFIISRQVKDPYAQYVEQIAKFRHTVIVLSYKENQYQPTSTEIARWIVPKEDGQSELGAQIDRTLVEKYVDEIAKQIDKAAVDQLVDTKGAVLRKGIEGIALDKPKVADAIMNAFNNGADLELDLPVNSVSYKTTVSKPTTRRASGNNFTYCVELKEVSTSYYDEFAAKAQAVYSSSLGWSLDGRVTFTKVSSGCNYILWLSRADLVPSFGGPCGATYSCQRGNNVVINFDRWSSGVSHWTLTLDDYRTMVLNHETGHWLGMSHRYCGGSGQTAPVMQQQSISLQGCNANPWPTQAEKQSFAAARGIAY